MPTVEIDIPPRSSYVGVVRLAVASLARAEGLDEEQVEDLRIAVSEACANAVLAHEEQDSDEPVSVRWIQDDSRIVIEVADRGATTEPA
ncbi:MAG TPA: ATP-binding protein, partial [Actinomycetota bacterium]|nr:ATP-binding protein [Actinomycetota bacterium]